MYTGHRTEGNNGYSVAIIMMTLTEVVAIQMITVATRKDIETTATIVPVFPISKKEACFNNKPLF